MWCAVTVNFLATFNAVENLQNKLFPAITYDISSIYILSLVMQHPEDFPAVENLNALALTLTSKVPILQTPYINVT